MDNHIISLEKSAMERWRNGDPWGWTEISAGDVSYVDTGPDLPDRWPGGLPGLPEADRRQGALPGLRIPRTPRADGR